MENQSQFEAKAENTICRKECRKYGTIYFECSAKKGGNVRNVFDTAAEFVCIKASERPE